MTDIVQTDSGPWKIYGEHEGSLSGEPMTNEEALEKAINLAIDGGWNIHWKSFEVEDGKLVTYSDGFSVKALWWSEIIFNHDFAKALWGKELITWQDDHLWESHTYPAFQAHLMQMVIDNDPIQYLGANI